MGKTYDFSYQPGFDWQAAFKSEDMKHVGPEGHG
jgi:hypothetical protein